MWQYFWPHAVVLKYINQSPQHATIIKGITVKQKLPHCRSDIKIIYQNRRKRQNEYH
jgi:hypothetical protein